MATEIIINVMPEETRVALLENKVVTEVYIDRKKRRDLVGNIYVGKVAKTLPGMQAAFIDIGLDRAAFFMHPTSFHPKPLNQKRILSLMKMPLMKRRHQKRFLDSVDPIARRLRNCCIRDKKSCCKYQKVHSEQRVRGSHRMFRYPVGILC